MRALPLVLLLALGCSQDDIVVPEHEAAADALLLHVRGDAWDDVFAQAPEASYIRVDGANAVPVDSVPNPLPSFLSDEPPYLDAAARDQYATSVVGDTVVAGRSARVVEARFVPDGRRSQPIRYVRAAVAPERGGVLAIEVRREMSSILFDEQSHFTASLASGARGLIPGTSSIHATTNVLMGESQASSIRWERRP